MALDDSVDRSSSSGQQFGFVENMDAIGPLPEARSEATQWPFSRLMVTVKLGGGGPRWITTVTLPLVSATADKTCGAVVKPFWVPVM